MNDPSGISFTDIEYEKSQKTVAQKRGEGKVIACARREVRGVSNRWISARADVTKWEHGTRNCQARERGGNTIKT